MPAIDIWPDNMAVSPSLICQARVQTLPNIDEPASSRATGVGFKHNRTDE
jgi:hypothetical protein